MEVSQGILMKRVKIDHPDAKEIFINAIHDNQVIAYPTDTIYGLGTAMNNDEGIERINLIFRYADLSPPTIIDNFPDFAPASPPDTGASTR